MRVAGGHTGLALALVLASGMAADAATTAGSRVGTFATYRWSSSVKEAVPVLIRQSAPGGQVSWSIAEESTTPPPIFVTYAVVRGDAKTYTLQIVTRGEVEGRPLSVTQVTVDRSSGKAVRSVIQRAKGVIATPESGLRPFREAAVPGGPREDVTVPAGRFTAVRGAAQGADVWVSDRVPALGLVKAVWPQGTLELVRSGDTGAKDLLRPATS
ncbi:MAG TPA: hypothetical protein VGW35_16880 [Methylomirabilota bacterium]|nr:hypothetical protein [Methylomirabilota bacterium]